MPDTDIALALNEPVQVIRPAGQRRRSKGDPSATRVIFTVLVLLVIAGLLAGALGSSMQESL